MSRCYSSEDFDIVTVKSMGEDCERFLSAKSWILSMTDSEDKETGSDFWIWIECNNEMAKKDPNHLLNTFVMFFRNDPNMVVATGSIVSDDRDMGKKLNLEDCLWIGGVNVHRDFRGRSFGKILMEYIDNYIEKIINKDTKVCLFTNNPRGKAIYKRYSFQSKGFIHNDTIKDQDPTVRTLYSTSLHIPK